MAEPLTLACSELILGGQKSGKSRRAERLAQAWLAASPHHRAVLVATAQAGDDEMRQRIARHQQDRALRVPAMSCVEAPHDLAGAIAAHSTPDTLVVVDCLTLWLTQQLMPPELSSEEKYESNRPQVPVYRSYSAIISGAIESMKGPLVLVSNEIGLGVIPLGAEVRAFVDALGALNQQVAAACERVTLMAAGLPLTLKGPT
jgi:adenosylcobinamide kinase / adenosylcobinamide-phosphate guanylyltransferase